MANEPTHVDGGESIGSRRIYYHWGLDIGGAEGMVAVLAATSGLVVGLGKAVLDSEKDNTSLDRPDRQYNDTIWVQRQRSYLRRSLTSA